LFSWLSQNLGKYLIPLLVFIAAAVVGLGTRMIAYKILTKPPKNPESQLRQFLIQTIWYPFLYWFILLGAYIAVQLSILSATVKRSIEQGVLSLFVLTVVWVAFTLSGGLIRFYLDKFEAKHSLISVALGLIRSTIVIIGILIILIIWGVPTLPLIIVFFGVPLIILLALRNTIDNIVAWFDIVFGEHIKVGNYIRVGPNELGQITHIYFTKTVMRTSEGNLVIIPNIKLIAETIVNYGAEMAEINTNNSQQLPLLDKTKTINDKLSDREIEVLKLIGIGATNHEIAQELSISEHTVKSHLRSILSKLNLRNRQQAAVYAEREGLITKIGIEEKNSDSNL